MSAVSNGVMITLLRSETAGSGCAQSPTRQTAIAYDGYRLNVEDVMWAARMLRSFSARVALLVAVLVGIVGGEIGVAAEQPGLPPAPEFASITVDQARVALVFRPSSLSPTTTSFLIEIGTAPGQSDLGWLPTVGFQTIVLANGVPAGNYHVRIRGVNAVGIGPPSEERVIAVPGCTAPPPIPTWHLISGSVLSAYLSWTTDESPCPATSYLLEGGSAPGLSDLGVLPVVGTSVTVQPVPAGKYYVRLRGRNAHGVSAPTRDVELFVIPPCLPPVSPIDFQASTIGNAVTFSWQLEPVVELPPTKTNQVSAAIEAGSAPGAANLASVSVNPTLPLTVWGPAGTYWTRVRTSNGCGASAVSNEVMLTLTDQCVVPNSPRWIDIVASPAGGDGRAEVAYLGPLTGAPVTDYVFDIGTAPGLSNVRDGFLLGPHPPVTGLAPGAYFGRVRALNVCGSSPPSPELPFIVGGACQLPHAPFPSVQVVGQTATISWSNGGSEFNPVAPGSILEIGTTPGAKDILVKGEPFGGNPFNKVFSMMFEPGHNFARVKLSNACGVSNPSIEVEFTILP
jgi:hypothetical protein